MLALGVDVGLKNLAMCALVVEGDGSVSEVRYWKVIDCVAAAAAAAQSSESPVSPAQPAGRKRKAAVTIADQVRLVVSALEGAGVPGDPDRVLIEAQPAGRGGNTTMKCLQHAIQAWFLLRRPGAPVCMVQARRKLGGSAPKSYAERKKRAVEVVRRSVLSLAPAGAVLGDRWVRLLGDSKKADDLADAFLIARLAGPVAAGPVAE